MHVWFSTFIQMCNYAFVVKIPWPRHDHLNNLQVPEEQVSVQLHNHVQLCVTPWTATRQASLPNTTSCSLCKLMSIKSVIPANHLILCCPLFLLPSSFPASASFLRSQFFTSGGQNIEASASVLPINIQDWFPLQLTGLILQSKGFSIVFSNTRVQKYPLFSA